LWVRKLLGHILQFQLSIDLSIFEYAIIFHLLSDYLQFIAKRGLQFCLDTGLSTS
jgi:hypothetical protein